MEAEGDSTWIAFVKNFTNGEIPALRYPHQRWVWVFARAPLFVYKIESAACILMIITITTGINGWTYPSCSMSFLFFHFNRFIFVTWRQ